MYISKVMENIDLFIQNLEAIKIVFLRFLVCFEKSLFRRDETLSLRNKLRSITGKVWPRRIGSFTGNGPKFLFLETKSRLKVEKLLKQIRNRKIRFYI